MKVLVFFILSVVGIQLFDDFGARQRPFHPFCTVNLTQNHLGWSIRQPPREWTNVTFNATFSWIQVTAHPGKWGAASNAIGWTIDYSNPVEPVTLHVNYWGEYVTLFFATFPAPCTRYRAHIVYGSHI